MFKFFMLLFGGVPDDEPEVMPIPDDRINGLRVDFVAVDEFVPDNEGSGEHGLLNLGGTEDTAPLHSHNLDGPFDHHGDPLYSDDLDGII